MGWRKEGEGKLYKRTHHIYCKSVIIDKWEDGALGAVWKGCSGVGCGGRPEHRAEEVEHPGGRGCCHPTIAGRHPPKIPINK